MLIVHKSKGRGEIKNVLKLNQKQNYVNFSKNKNYQSITGFFAGEAKIH